MLLIVGWQQKGVNFLAATACITEVVILQIQSTNWFLSFYCLEKDLKLKVSLVFWIFYTFFSTLLFCSGSCERCSSLSHAPLVSHYHSPKPVLINIPLLVFQRNYKEMIIIIKKYINA